MKKILFACLKNECEKNKSFNCGKYYFINCNNLKEIITLLWLFKSLGILNILNEDGGIDVFNLRVNNQSIVSASRFIIRNIPRGDMALNFTKFVEIIKSNENLSKYLEIAVNQTDFCLKKLSKINDIYIQNIKNYRLDVNRLLGNESKTIATFYDPHSKKTSMLISFKNSYGCRLNGWTEIINNSLKSESYSDFITILKNVINKIIFDIK